MKKTLLHLLLFLGLLLISVCEGSSLYTDIYRPLDAAPCVLLLDKNGPVGCSSSEDGATGDLHVVHNSTGLDELVAHPPNDDFAVALPANLFNKETVDKLHGTKKLKGILLLYSAPLAAGWSPDTQFPNEQWGLRSNNPTMWNPQGDGLNFVKIPVPVYALSQSESESITASATTDTSYPRQAVRFNTFMHATVNAETCLRRSQCQPLGGKSVWSSFGSVGQKPIVMAMANIDSTALFHDLAVGADSTVSGIVGLVGTALALQQVNKTTFTKDIVFSFWAGESWGYLGSRKFLDDIQNFKCKKMDTSSGTCDEPYKTDLSFQAIKLENIETAIEFNQIGLSTDKLFLHQQSSASDALASLLQNVGETANLPLVNANQLPPSSLMSFLNANPNLPGIVITDHENDYANRNFHSHLDNGIFHPLSNSTICSAATTLARTLYLLATNQSQPDAISNSIEAPCELLAELTYCLTSNFSCDLISNFMGSPRVTTPTYYTGVFGYSIYSQYLSSTAVLLNNILSLTTAQNLYYNFTSFQSSLPVEGCKKCSDSQACVQGICVTSETHYHDAISLGIDWDYSNSKWKIVNEAEPLWVESDWDSLAVEIFHRANPTTEAVFLTVGILEFIVSLVAVFYAKRYFLRNFKIF